MHFYQIGQKPRFYVEKIYQERMNIKMGFTDLYEPGIKYTDIKAFQSAFGNLDYSFYWETERYSKQEVDEWVKRFEDNFIKNFEPGRSIISYC